MKIDAFDCCRERLPWEEKNINMTNTWIWVLVMMKMILLSTTPMRYISCLIIIESDIFLS